MMVTAKEGTGENIPRLELYLNNWLLNMFREKMFLHISKENRAKRNQTGMRERIPGFIVIRGCDRGQRCYQKSGSPKFWGRHIWSLYRKLSSSENSYVGELLRKQKEPVNKTA